MKYSKVLSPALFLLLLLCWAGYAHCLSDKALRHNWEREIRWRISQGLVYVYGGNVFETGVDCSSFPYLTLKEAGAKRLQRLTADDIFRGKDGWLGIDVKIRDADHLDLVFCIWAKHRDVPLELPKSLTMPGSLTLDKAKRIRVDHIGIVIVGAKSKLLEVAHISSTRGGVIEPFKGDLERDCVGVRRLTIGDKGR